MKPRNVAQKSKVTPRTKAKAKPKAPVPPDGPAVTEPCTPQPAFFPAMPTTASAMPGYLAKTQGVRLHDVNDVAKVVGGLFQSDYLLPAQRAALYEFLATMPGLTLERNVKDITGRPGIGVGWSFMGGKALLIFDPGTYTLLGMTTRGEQGQVGGGAVLQMAITNRAGQRPRLTTQLPVWWFVLGTPLANHDCTGSKRAFNNSK